MELGERAFGFPYRACAEYPAFFYARTWRLTDHTPVCPQTAVQCRKL